MKAPLELIIAAIGLVAFASADAALQLKHLSADVPVLMQIDAAAAARLQALPATHLAQ